MKSLCVFPLALSLFFLALCSSVAKEMLSDEIYDALIRIIKGERPPPVKEHTRAQRSAYYYYYGEVLESPRGFNC